MACTSQELADFYQACMVGDIKSAACIAYQADAGACTQCLVSQTTSATWGPVVVGGYGTTVNIAGCIAITQNDATTTSCAQKASDELGCEALACDAVCPVDVDAGLLAYDQCVEDVAATSCNSYLAAECDPADGGFTACIPHPLDAATFAALASVFCGGS